MSAFFPQRTYDSGIFAPQGQCRSVADQANALVNLRAIKRNGRMHNLLCLLHLANEHSGGPSVVIPQGDVRNFRNFRGLAYSTNLVDVRLCATEGAAPYGFTRLTDTRGGGIVASDTGGRFVCMRLTTIGRWMAFGLLWDMSPFAMCVAAVINVAITQSAKNWTICKDSCTCHGTRIIGVHEKRNWNPSPLTALMCSRKFPECSKTKIMRALRELENCEMITISKKMRCAIIRSNPDHPLLSCHAHILARLATVINDQDTLENATRHVKFVQPTPRRSSCQRS